MFSTIAVTALALASSVAASPLVARQLGTLQYLGTNIAGFDFGCTTDGTCNTTAIYPAIGGAYPDGAGQMQHFVKDDGFNLFRLPVGWQYLVGNQLGGTLNSANLAKYDTLVQACLATGASCIIDIHNYARWNGQIIGQGGPSNAQFASLWTQLATKYGSNSKILFGLMNEPHDVDVTAWAATLQYVVTQVRPIAKTTLLLLPGSSYSSAQTLPTEAGPALLGVKNPDGTTTGLIFDVHKYLDSDNSGTHTECVTNNIATAFQPLATWLRANGRQALNTETGGGASTASCQTDLCQQIAFVKQNSDVFLGVTGWSAGSFDATYELTETPTKQGNSWVDSPLVKACLANQRTGPAPATTSTAAPAPGQTTSAAAVPTAVPTTAPVGTNCASQYGQCGGIGWSGATCCASGTTCKASGSYYSQCL